MMKSAGAGPASSSPHSHHIRKQHGQSIFNCRSCLVVLFFLAFVAILYGEDVSCALRQAYSQPPQPAQQQQKRPQKLVPEGQDQKVFDHSYERDLPFAVGDEEGAGARLGGCDVFSGRWVYDPSSRPQYQEDECPYIQPQLTCLEHGRPERSHQYWRWQPHGCSLPSFNATFMLEKLRGKRVLYVGDSLNRGQFVSMVCLLHRVILESAKSMETFDSLTVFTAKDYNATIEFYWAPFLVESNSDNAVIHRVTDRIVRAGAIEKHAKNWKGADVVVFNTYLWWMTGQKMKILRGSFTDEQTKNDIQLMETEDAYRLALRSMIGWVEKNIDPKASRVFFASMSPSHEKGTGWGGEPGSNCYNQTSPIFDPSYWGSADVNIMRALTEELGKASPVPVTLLNITQLSEYRKDAHTSIYKKQWSPLTPEQIANPRSYADCVHWCLPGLQDTWNELLYAKLFFP